MSMMVAFIFVEQDSQMPLLITFFRTSNFIIVFRRARPWDLLCTLALANLIKRLSLSLHSLADGTICENFAVIH